MPCIIPGCRDLTASRYTHVDGAVCPRHWFKMPLKLRQRYWQETAYGNDPPSTELVEAFIAAHRGEESHDPTGASLA